MQSVQTKRLYWVNITSCLCCAIVLAVFFVSVRLVGRNLNRKCTSPNIAFSLRALAIYFIWILKKITKGFRIIEGAGSVRSLPRGRGPGRSWACGGSSGCTQTNTRTCGKNRDAEMAATSNLSPLSTLSIVVQSCVCFTSCLVPCTNVCSLFEQQW